MFFEKESDLVKKLIGFYFVLALIELVINGFFDKHLLYVIKPLMVFLLFALYWFSSTQKNSLFFVISVLLLIVGLFMLPNTANMLFCAMVLFVFIRIIMLYYIAKLLKIKDYIPLFLASIPFVFIYFNLLSLAGNIDTKTYGMLIVQVLLMSMLVGMTVSEYFMNNDKKSLWLLIFGLLSATQSLMYFIEKFLLLDLTPISFRLLPVLLTIGVNFTFYKFVVEAERCAEN